MELTESERKIVVLGACNAEKRLAKLHGKQSELPEEQVKQGRTSQSPIEIIKSIGSDDNDNAEL